MPKELWRPVYAGYYAVSNYGRIMRTAPGQGTYPGRILQPYWPGGAPYIGLYQGDGDRIQVPVYEILHSAFPSTGWGTRWILEPG